MAKPHLEPPPQALIEPLLELRDYYAALVEEYERLSTQARSQLTHVEAILSNYSLPGLLDNQTAIVETLSFPPTPSQEASHLQQVPDKISNFKQEEFIQLELKDNGKQESSVNELALQNANGANGAIAAVPTVIFSPQRIPFENDDRTLPGSDVPMQPQFHGLPRLEAIESILRENMGTVCHIDFIVRTLYGDLESSVFKVVKSRVQSSLTHGKEKGYWSAVPEEPGCYTLDISLVTPQNGKSKSKAVKPKKKKPFLLPKARRVPMLAEFEGKFLIDAICILLQRNSGRIFSVGDVITGLYGELNAEQLREIKTAVHNELSRGHRIGRFSRVPDKLGYYTWDLNKIR
ncbi:hypothetical protein AB0756_00425 [Tolypothrix campylonemoides VB511288_2]|uniref:Uncharacterized protein n=4 Tax=Cyanophyceae TaxID=3028117 RepID=A0A0C1RJG6_9CYAN|nr:hypothetical protein [Tolypothrix bouteillei]KAF3891338.1 hypothetical protein DA73_0400037540 [Tolypothrix bouteillei VB521301]